MAECDELNSEAQNISAIANSVSEIIEHEYQLVVSQESIETGPFAGQKANRIKLGPFIKPKFVKELLPSLGGYPDTPSLPPFIYSPNELHCPWTKDTIKPLAGWTTSHDTLDWFNRLSSRHEKWKSQRIYEFLKLSSYPCFPFDGVLSASLLSCWNPCLNVFITGQGPMTVTLEDIAYITGLSPSGIELPYHKHVEGALDISNILFLKGVTKVSALSFPSYISMYKGGKDDEVTREEEILFINFSLCKMLMAPSIKIYRRFLLLAANIEASPADKPLALAPFLLAQFYRCMYRLRTANSLTNAGGGPLWLLTFWGFLYFPSLVSIKSQEETHESFTNDLCMPPSSVCCYGEVATLLLSVPSGKMVAEILSTLLQPPPPSGPYKVNWHPCSAKDEMDGPLDSVSSWAKFAIPQWLREISPIMYKSEDSAHWQAILAQRDLLYVGPKAIGVEVYNPNLAARQFGMIQACAVPLYQTQNRPWGSRLEFLVRNKKDNEESHEWKYQIEKSLTSSHTFKITDFNVQPWFPCADVDDGFNVWWNDFWNRHKKGKTLITSQQILIKTLDKNRFKAKSLDTTPSSIGTRKETDEAAKGHPPEMVTRTPTLDSVPFSCRSPRTKNRISASQIPQLKVDLNMETMNRKVAEEEEDVSIPLCRFKRRRSKGSNCPTPVSLDSTAKQGRIGESQENVEMNEDPSNAETLVECAPISRCSMLSETTTEPLMAENADYTPSNGPSNIDLNEEATPEPGNQHVDAEAHDSVKALGKISARIEKVLKALTHNPSPNISPLESKKASLLDTLEELVNNPENFDSFDALMGLAQEFTELAPSSFQSTMDFLKRSITSIRDVTYKLKNQGPKISSFLNKKSSMEQLKLEVEKKVDRVDTLRKTHVNICTKIEFLESELMKLERQRDAVGEQLVNADNEVASLSHQLEGTVTALEDEADWLAKSELMMTSWDQDMKVFKSAIVGVIEQLRSLQIT